MGDTKMKGVTWKISESVSPKGTHVTVQIDGGEHGAAWFYMDSKQAREMSDDLKNAADWADAHV